MMTTIKRPIRAPPRAAAVLFFCFCFVLSYHYIVSFSSTTTESNNHRQSLLLLTDHLDHKNQPIIFDTTTTTTTASTTTTTTASTSGSIPFNKTEGKGWKLWDRKSVLHAIDDNNIKGNGGSRVCEWTTFRYRDFPEGITTTNNNDKKKVVVKATKSIPMCVHKSPDVLSDVIRQKGGWDECQRLVDMWNYEEDSIIRMKGKNDNETNNESNRSPKIFVDIGANIGACVLQMLLETDALVVAFEPNPRNLFSLTSTLLLLNPELRNRVYVFPIGIGESTGSASIGNDLRTNAGATMLNTQEGGGGVSVEPLDNILPLSDIYIPVVKIDVQGFECKVLRGMERFLQSLPPTVSSVFTEVEKRYLKAAGCKSEEIFHHLKNAQYSIYKDDGESPISRLSKIESPLDEEDFYNIVARREPYEDIISVV